MARPNERELVQLGPWPNGVWNVPREDSLPASALRAAVNVDLNAAGKAELRDGYDLKLAATEPHSAWGNGAFCVFVEGGVLKRLATDYTASSLRAGLKPAVPMSYAEINSELYFSNGYDCGKVDLVLGSARLWGVETPLGVVGAAPNAVGGLFAGTYQVVITYVLATGEEGGAGLGAEVQVAEGGGIQLSYIPQPRQAGVSAIRIYATDANGTDFFYRQSLPVGTTSYLLGVRAQGRRLETQFLSPMPPGHLIAYFDGRLYAWDNNVLCYSKAQRYGLTNPATDFILYPSRGTLLAPVSAAGDGAGIYIAIGESTFFLSGAEPKDFQQIPAYASGAIEGSLVYVPGSAFDPDLQLGAAPVPVWLASNGYICVGAKNGRVVPLTEGRFAADANGRMSGLFREIDGKRQVIFSGPKAAVSSTARSGDEVSVTVIRNGVEVAA